MAGQLELMFRAVEAAHNGVIITDPNQADNPIIYSNPAFTELTGYTQDEILGKNCRFLQGEDRQQPSLPQLRKAIDERRCTTVILRNYKKDGTRFFNELRISPVFNEQGIVTHFVWPSKRHHRQDGWPDC